MFTYDLREDRKRKRLVYAPALSFRILCLFFALALAAGLWTLTADSGWEASYLVPLAIMLLLLLSALYRDEWVIDNKRKSFTVLSGVGPFVARKDFPYSEVRRLELTHFIKGLPDGTDIKPSFKHRAFVVLRIRLKEETEEEHQLEIMPEKTSGGKLERAANIIASYTGLELFIDRPRDESAEISRFF